MVKVKKENLVKVSKFCVHRKGFSLFVFTDVGFSPILGVVKTLCSPENPLQITQSYGGDCPANKVDCIALQILSAKTYNRRVLANPTDKYARQCSGGPCLWLGTSLHWLVHLSVGFARHRR